MAFQQQDNFLGRGWSFPPTFNLQSKEVQMTEKVEDIEEMMKYNVLTTPVLVINEEIKIKGRIAQIDEIKELLK